MWPTPQDYNEALQNPGLSFEDNDLRSGTAETNALGLPKPRSGSFASVYHVLGKDADWAVRCFLHHFPDQQERYAAIGEHLRTQPLPHAVDFSFLSKGILIRNQWFPMLKMEWTNGQSLHEWINEHILKTEDLERLQQEFVVVCKTLAKAGIAHGDLQHGNILVANGEIKLVDYDCMFVPSLKHLKSNELGHRNYQHPHRSRDHFFAGLDHFSAWSIYTSLFCIAKDPVLWRNLNGGDDCLLFKLHDYKQPNESHAFRTLEHHESAEIRDAARRLRKLLSLSIEDLPPLGAEIEGIDDLPALPEPVNLPNWLVGDAGGVALTVSDTAGGATRSPSEVLDNLARTVSSTTATFTTSSTAPRLVPPVMLPPNVSTQPIMKLSGLSSPPPNIMAPTGGATAGGSYPTLPSSNQGPRDQSKNALYSLTFAGFVIIVLLVCLFVGFMPVIFKFGNVATTITTPVSQPSATQTAERPLEPANKLFYDASDLATKHEYAAAIAKFESAMAQYASDNNEEGKERCMYEIAKCFEKAGDRPQSLSWLESALEQFPNTQVAKQEYPVIGKMYSDQGDLTKAVFYLGRSLQWNNILDRNRAFESSRLLRQIGLKLLDNQQAEGLEAYQQALSFEDMNRFRNPVEYFQQLRDAAVKLEKAQAYELATKVWWQAYQSTIDYPGDEHPQRMEALKALKRIAEKQGNKEQIDDANWRIEDAERKYENRKARKRHREPPVTVPNPRARELPPLDTSEDPSK